MKIHPELAELLELDDEKLRFKRIGDFIERDPVLAQTAGKHLVDSTGPRERRLGADVLGQLATMVLGARGQIAGDLLAALDLRDDGDVVASFAIALGHAADPRAKELLIGLSEHPDSSVRFAVAFALPALGLDERTVDALRLLCGDVDPDVRDWATFALAESDATDEKTRRVLLARSRDPDGDTRAEAIYGLARRRDPTARGLIERELASTQVGELILRARDELADGSSADNER